MDTDDLSLLLNQAREFFEYEGKRYAVKELTVVQLAQLATWLKERAAQQIELMTWLPEARRDRMYNDLRDVCALGRYDPGGDIFAQLQFQRDGIVKSLHLCIEADHPAIALEDCEKMVDAKATKIAEAIIKANPIDPKASWAHQEGSPGGVTS